MAWFYYIIRYWHRQHTMRRRVYVTVRCPTVPAWAHSSKPAAAGLLLWARRAGDIDRLLNGRCSAAAAGECGQCHAVSVCRKLNTDWFVNTSGELQKSAHNDANCRLQTVRSSTISTSSASVQWPTGASQ